MRPIWSWLLFLLLIFILLYVGMALEDFDRKMAMPICQDPRCVYYQQKHIGAKIYEKHKPTQQIDSPRE